MKIVNHNKLILENKCILLCTNNEQLLTYTNNKNKEYKTNKPTNISKNKKHYSQIKN